ncbi:MAG: hypothetical protein ACR2O4_07535 [Hyphomicrobiaceae bacterium]
MASIKPPSNGNGNGGSHSGSQFGSCCEAMSEILGSEDFSPTFAVEDTGILYMAVGCAEIEADNEEDGGIAWFDQAVMFCPFCGVQLQTPEEIEAKVDEIESE